MMKVEVTPCGQCKWWSDTPRLGDDGKACARCRLTGWVTDGLFFCKHGEKEPNDEERLY